MALSASHGYRERARRFLPYEPLSGTCRYRSCCAGADNPVGFCGWRRPLRSAAASNEPRASKSTIVSLQDSMSSPIVYLTPTSYLRERLGRQADAPSPWMTQAHYRGVAAARILLRTGSFRLEAGPCDLLDSDRLLHRGRGRGLCSTKGNSCNAGGKKRSAARNRHHRHIVVASVRVRAAVVPTSRNQSAASVHLCRWFRPKVASPGRSCVDLSSFATHSSLKMPGIVTPP